MKTSRFSNYKYGAKSKRHHPTSNGSPIKCQIKKSFDSQIYTQLRQNQFGVCLGGSGADGGVQSFSFFCLLAFSPAGGSDFLALFLSLAWCSELLLPSAMMKKPVLSKLLIYSWYLSTSFSWASSYGFFSSGVSLFHSSPHFFIASGWVHPSFSFNWFTFSVV